MSKGASSNELERENARLEKELEEANEKIEGLEEDLEDLRSEATSQRAAQEDAINAFCDVVERPVGRLEFAVPSGSHANRAITGLFDAIGRRP